MKTPLSRRDFVAAAGMVSMVSVASGVFAETIPQRQPGVGGNVPGPQDTVIQDHNPVLLNPPATDSGTLPNLRFSFGEAHVRQGTGGSRQVTQRELPVSTTIAGVDMRLNTGGIREMHWHKQAEWAYMTVGKARISAIDSEGRLFIDDVGEGDLWYLPRAFPTPSKAWARTAANSCWPSTTAVSTRTAPSCSATGSATCPRMCWPRTSG